MIDIAELREALDELEYYELWPHERTIKDAARELLTIREAGALIIVPDENGKWPEWAKHEEGDYWSGRLCSHFLYRDVLNALRDAKPDGET